MSQHERSLNDEESVEQVEQRINNTDNQIWAGNMNLDTFVVIVTHHPEAFEATIKMGFKNPVAENPDNPGTVRGHVFNVDVMRAEEILDMSREELYNKYMEKSKTIILEKVDQ